MRKICRVLFSRYMFCALAILLEIALLFTLFVDLAKYSLSFIATWLVLSILAVLRIVNQNTNPEFRLTWIVVVMCVPYIGIFLYFTLSRRKLSRKDSEIMRVVMHRPGMMGESPVSLVAFSGRYPTYGGQVLSVIHDDPLARLCSATRSDYYTMGADMYCDMLRDIKAAESFIFLEYFIIEKGVMWDEILAVLREKVKCGVDVRVIYDDIGCMSTLPSHYDRTLQRYGIKCCRFASVTPRVTIANNNRDHRKILVVDGKISYTGGINIADEYIGERVRFGVWKDGGIRLEGEAVTVFTRMFLTAWELTTREHEDISRYLEVCHSVPSDGGYYLPFGTGPAPVYSEHGGKNALLNMINGSTRYLYITTPYLIIDFDLTEALQCAARRGVDVRIITPGVPDKKIVNIMTKSSYYDLITAGVRIFEYTPGFLHMKSVVTDDGCAFVSTVNFDYRSLIHHFEDGVLIFGTDPVVKVRDGFLETLAQSREIDARGARLRFSDKIIKSCVRLFAPLL